MTGNLNAWGAFTRGLGKKKNVTSAEVTRRERESLELTADSPTPAENVNASKKKKKTTRGTERDNVQPSKSRISAGREDEGRARHLFVSSLQAR